MDSFLEIARSVLVIGGAVFCVIGGIGLLRFPDFYTRIHAAGITDTMGAGLMLIGLMLYGGWSLVTVKLVTVLCFLFLTSPTSSHALAKAAFHGGVKVVGRAEDRRSAISN